MNVDWHGAAAEHSYRFSIDNDPAVSEADLESVRQYRLQRVRAQMARLDIAACVLSDPVSVRYATDTRNMQIFTARNTPSRYLLVTDKHSILYEFPGCMHLARGYSTITDIRPARTASFVSAGDRVYEQEALWAKEMAATIRELVGKSRRVAMERMNAGAAIALANEGFQ